MNHGAHSVLEALLEALPGPGIPVEEVLVGAHWTMVRSRHAGLATTLRDADPQHGDPCGPFADAGILHLKMAQDLARLVRMEHPLGRSIGLAAINSLLEVEETRCCERGAFELLAQQGQGRKVAVVGHFPFVDRLRELVGQLWVLEQRPRPGDHPADEATILLPRCDVVCLTGTTLLNGTFDDLMALCSHAFVVLTGPSSPLSPVLFERGVSAICGARVADPDGIRPFVAQGAAFKQFHTRGVRLLTLLRDAGAVPEAGPEPESTCKENQP